jgi:hypothetical protein
MQRDPGIGDVWKTPLPNGYVLMMIDLPDYGWIYNPATQPMLGGVIEREDAIFGVRELQVANRYLANRYLALGVDPHVLENFGTDTVATDSWFLLDTIAGTRGRYASRDDLWKAASAVGVQLSLEPIDRVYWKYRPTPFDRFVRRLFVIPPLLGMTALGLWVILLRRVGGTPS